MIDRFSNLKGSVHVYFALVASVAALGMIRVAMSHWREGATLLGGSLLLAAAIRMFASPEKAGLLAIRSRVVDAVLYGGFGLLIVAVAVTIKGGPLST